MSQNNIYNKQNLKDTMLLLDSQIEDLSMWSVYNKDKFSVEIFILKATLDIIKQQI